MNERHLRGRKVTSKKYFRERKLSRSLPWKGDTIDIFHGRRSGKRSSWNAKFSALWINKIFKMYSTKCPFMNRIFFRAFFMGFSRISLKGASVDGKVFCG